MHKDVRNKTTSTSAFRPFAKLGLLFCSVFFAASFCPFSFVVKLAILFLLAGIILLILPKKLLLKRAAVGFLLVALAFGYFSAYTALCYFPSQDYAGKISQIEGKITDIEMLNSGTFRYTVRVNKVEDHEFTIPFCAYLYAQDAIVADYGDELSSIVALSSTSQQETLSLEDYSRSKGIFLQGTLTEDVAITPKTHPSLSVFCLHIRDRLTESLKLYTHTPNSELACGIIFGNRDGIPFDIADDFTMAGFSHLLAVSGLHMTMLVSFVVILLSLFRIPPRIARILALAVLFIFSVMVGLSPSVLRALIMSATALIAFLLSRDFDGRNALGFTALVLVLFSPYSIMDIGFLLSFSSTLGIFLLTSRLQTMCKNALPFATPPPAYQLTIIESFSVSLSALIFTLPFCLLSFNTFSIISPISNIIAAPLSGAILLFGMFTAILGLFCPPLASLFGFLTDVCTSWLIQIADFFANLPFATLPTDYAWITLCLLLSLLLLIVCYFSARKTAALKTGALLCCLIFLTGAFSHQVINRDTISLAVLGNETGYSIVVSYGSHAVVLGCGGDSYSGENTYHYLEGRGIETIDLLILPELTKKYSSGAPFLVNHCEVANIIAPFEGRNFEQLSLAAENNNANLFELSTMTVDIHPVHLLIDTRYTSPVVLLTIGESTIGYSQDAEAIEEASNSYEMNILLINDKIDDTQLYNNSSYVILLNNQQNLPSDYLQVHQDASLRLNWNHQGLIMENIK